MAGNLSTMTGWNGKELIFFGTFLKGQVLNAMFVNRAIPISNCLYITPITTHHHIVLTYIFRDLSLFT